MSNELRQCILDTVYKGYGVGRPSRTRGKMTGPVSGWKNVSLPPAAGEGSVILMAPPRFIPIQTPAKGRGGGERAGGAE